MTKLLKLDHIYAFSTKAFTNILKIEIKYFINKKKYEFRFKGGMH